MAIETEITLKSIQRIIFIAMTFSGMFFTLAVLGAGYQNQCVNLHALIIFAVTAYLAGIPFSIFMEFFVAPYIKRGK